MRLAIGRVYAVSPRCSRSPRGGMRVSLHRAWPCVSLNSRIAARAFLAGSGARPVAQSGARGLSPSLINRSISDHALDERLDRRNRADKRVRVATGPPTDATHPTYCGHQATRELRPADCGAERAKENFRPRSRTPDL